MLKTAMLVSALALSAPAVAQSQKPASKPVTTAPAKPQTSPAADTQDVTAPVTPTTAADAAPVAGQTAPAEQAAAAAPQTTPANPVAPAETAATSTAPAGGAEPAAVTGATQIAQVVSTEFPTYDKNADTNLDKTEFGAWMVALKTASDPATKPGDPATVKWIDGAFASADADKSKAVSKDELTKYLSQGAE